MNTLLAINDLKHSLTYPVHSGNIEINQAIACYIDSLFVFVPGSHLGFEILDKFKGNLTIGV